MKPVSLEVALANGYGYPLTNPYLEHEGWMLANALDSLRKGNKDFCLVWETNSTVHGKMGTSIYLKGVRHDSP